MFSQEDCESPTPEEYSSSVISNQPTLTISRDQEWGTRRPIPVSTIDWQSSTTSHFSPLHGLDFLLDVDRFIIQQTVELSDLLSNVASENRYVVKVPRGETIYYATENSTSFQRTCFAASRAFCLRLYDPTQQEAIQFRRRLAFGSCCSFFCYLQEMEVWVPPGEYLGKIRQNFHVSRPHFSIYNKNDNVIYIIEGPDSFLGCMMGKNHNFQIYSNDGGTQLGSMVHQWDQIQVAYNLFVQMPGSEENSGHKALMIGAAFLMEYMYFEFSKRTKRCKCIC